MHCACYCRTCAGKAATRYSLGLRLTVAGRHFLHLFALLSADLVMIASSSERALVEFVFVLPVSSAGVAYPSAKDSFMFSWERSFLYVVMFISGRLVNPVTSACASWMVFRDRLAQWALAGLRSRQWQRASWVSKPCRPWSYFRLKGISSCVEVCWMLGLDDGPTRFPTVWWYMYAFMKANVTITLLWRRSRYEYYQHPCRMSFCREEEGTLSCVNCMLVGQRRMVCDFLMDSGLSGLVLLDAGDSLRCIRRCGWLFFSFLFSFFFFNPFTHSVPRGTPKLSLFKVCKRHVAPV